ncbi:MAG: hypothetical protein QM532_04100 [Cyanobium sp. MAG06]|nr:hypothetical protein [Cyanobium sp. MAG06]
MLNVRGSIKDRNQFFINAYNSEQSFNKDCSLIINKYIRECS